MAGELIYQQRVLSDELNSITKRTGQLLFTTDTKKIYLDNNDSERIQLIDSFSWNNLTDKPSVFPPSSHTHEYLPLSGGTVDGDLTITGTINAKTGKEHHFALGSYTDPAAGLSCAVKVSGNFSATTLYEGPNRVALKTDLNNYLSLNGGTINGSLNISKYLSYNNKALWSVYGTSGTSGYVKILTMQINQNYVNGPITLVYGGGRNAGASSTVFINFQNNAGTDPSLYVFAKVGPDNFYIHKSATSTWDLYVAKTEGYDNTTVADFFTSDYMYNKITFTRKNEHASSLPSGYIACSNYIYPGYQKSITSGTASPSGGSSGDIYIKYS